MPAEVLTARDVTVTAATRPVVDRVSFALRAGEVVGLTGPSGAGKSTLAYALLGIARAPMQLARGSVAVAGIDMLAAREAEAAAVRGRRIALVVQNPRAALHPMLPVGHQVARIWQAHHRGSRAAAAAHAVDMLRLVGIADPERRAAAFPHELSGGMAQRVLIAAALAAKPDVLIADEPTSGLDVTVQAQFLDLMWRSAREAGTAMLLITQEPGILANYCDRILTLDEGRLVADEPAVDYFGWRAATATLAPPPVPDAARPVVAAVRDLSKSFPVRGSRNRVHAVAGVDFDLAAGETLGLVGESGSGKTTAGRAMLRLIEPDGGSVTVAGQALQHLSSAQLRRLRPRMQLVRQDPYDSFNPRWTMARATAEPLRAAGARNVEARVAEVLGLVGCSAAAGARPRDLPAGTLQGVAVARALATAPEVVVLDEPTSVLAPDARRALVATLRAVQQASGAAFLFISHDLTTVASVSHRVAVMYLGQIVEIGAARAIFDAPLHPYTRALIAAHLGEDPARRRVDRAAGETLTGEVPSPIDLPPGCYLASRCSHVQPRCVAERQPLRRVGDREVRCWRAGDLPAFVKNDA